MPIDFSDLGAVPVSQGNKIDFSDLGAVPISTPKNYIMNGNFDDKAYIADHPQGSGPNGEEALLRGAAQGASLNAQPTLSAPLERAYAQLFGDQNTKDLYNNLSNEDLKKTYVEQNQNALQAHPGAYVTGNLLGSTPLAIASGAGASQAATKLGANLGLGSLAASEAVPAATGAARAGLIGLNAGTQGLTQGSLGGVAGYNANPLASDEQKLANAKSGAETGAALGGGLAGLGQVAPTLTRNLVGAGLGAIAGNITHPLSPTLKATTLGALGGLGVANVAPALLNKFGTYNDIADFNQYGKNGIPLASTADENAVTGKVSDIANQVKNAIGDLDKEVTAPAMTLIQDTHEAYVRKFATELGATPEQVDAIVENGQQEAAQKYELLRAQADAEGKSVSAQNVMDLLNSQLKSDIQTGGRVVNPDQRATVQNAIDSANSFITKKGLPINIKSSTILNAEGKPFLSNLSVAGKSLSAEDVKGLIDPNTGQLSPEAIETLGGPNAQVNPQGSNIKTTQMGGFNPEGAQIPNTSAQGPQQIPASSISPEDLEAGEGMQTLPATQNTSNFNSSEQPPFSTQIESKQQIIPQETNNGVLSVPEAMNLKQYLGELGYDSSSLPSEVTGRFRAASSSLNDIIADAFQPAEEGVSNPYRDVNKTYTALHELSNVIGEPIPLYSTGDKIPSNELQSVIKGVKNAVASGDNSKFERIVELLSVIDPKGASKFSQNVQDLTESISNLKAAGTDPLAQQASLAAQGLSTPETEKAAEDIRNIQGIKAVAGGSGEIPDANNPGKFIIDPKNVSFVKNLVQSGSENTLRSSADEVTKAQVDNTLGLLRKYNQPLVDMLETQGKSVARQSELLANNEVNPKSLLGRGTYFIKQAVGRGANVVGQGQNYLANKNPITSPFFQALPAMIKTSSPLIQKYLPALAAAYQRGNDALTATNYSLSQTDPEYRAGMAEFNQRFQ